MKKDKTTVFECYIFRYQRWFFLKTNNIRLQAVASQLRETMCSLKNTNVFIVATLCAAAFAAAGTVSATPLAEPIKPLPDSHGVAAEKARLGEKLFSDVRFSDDNTISCASCHNVAKNGGADPRNLSMGVKGAMGALNAPSVLNAAHNFRQFWDGRADTLENQMGFVIENPVELASNWEAVMEKLQQDPALVREFTVVYGDGLTRANVQNAIVSYQLTLPSRSRFDNYLLGDAGAISDEEREGYQRFKSYGCISCHQGVNVGGNMYQKFGILGDYFQDRGDVQPSDYGRFNVTSRESDRYVFKVPSLRNVALTAPYFHDGSAATLEEAVDVMFKYQLGRAAPAEDKRLIIKFLNSLTGIQYQ